jgi:uroporphyrinogen-III decarboxylase
MVAALFNLGHGVIPETPPEIAARLISMVQGVKY